MINSLLQQAKSCLQEGHFTCVLADGKHVLTTTERGIQPLRHWLQSGQSFENYVAADRVVGKAAAFLYVLLGVRAVYAEIVSVPAAEVLNHYGIQLSYEKQVDAIRNRTGDGFCPMEQSVRMIDDPNHALEAIEQALHLLRSKQASNLS